MRFLIFVVAVSGLACSSPVAVGNGIPSRFSSTLGAVYCYTEIGLRPAPCMTAGAASHTDYVDSGRVVFASDGKVQWMLATHSNQCPCYLGGCTNPCYNTAESVATQSGTYATAGDSIVLQFTQGSPATQTLVGKQDSLVCQTCGGFYATVFKSP